ncbi:MAG: ABC transporter ATP-binding protein [Bacteroidales bacterium]|nr:ABC transporter ATP-binding protein [Bacteroidales bacterium]
MNRIVLENIAKKYAREWIFREVNYEFMSSQAYVILGSNGSGKSTLLQIVSSFLTPSKGSIKYYADEQEIAIEQMYKHFSIATPYLELPEEFSLIEVLDFHRKLKPFYNDYSNEHITDLMGLSHAKNKLISNYSSGMKQRVKLGLAILSKSDLLLIDEPSSNLDSQSIQWYQDLIQKYRKDRIIVICSNHIKAEYEFCEHEIVMEGFK